MLTKEVRIILSINTSVEGLKGIEIFRSSPVTATTISNAIPAKSTSGKRPRETNADTDVYSISQKKHKANKMGWIVSISMWDFKFGCCCNGNNTFVESCRVGSP